MWIRWHTCVTVGTEIYNGNLSRLLQTDVMLIQHPAIINTFSKMWMYVSCPEMVKCTCITTLMILCAGEFFSVPCGNGKKTYPPGTGITWPVWCAADGHLSETCIGAAIVCSWHPVLWAWHSMLQILDIWCQRVRVRDSCSCGDSSEKVFL